MVLYEAVTYIEVNRWCRFQNILMQWNLNHFCCSTAGRWRQWHFWRTLQNSNIMIWCCEWPINLQVNGRVTQHGILHKSNIKSSSSIHRHFLWEVLQLWVKFRDSFIDFLRDGLFNCWCYLPLKSINSSARIRSEKNASKSLLNYSLKKKNQRE